MYVWVGCSGSGRPTSKMYEKWLAPKPVHSSLSNGCAEKIISAPAATHMYTRARAEQS